MRKRAKGTRRVAWSPVTVRGSVQGAGWPARFACVLASVVTLSFAMTPLAGASSAAWTNTTLHVVGGPVVAGHMVLVLNVTPQHELEISGVNPATGAVAWSHPYSPSQITEGAAFTPIAVGATALVLAPSASLSNPVVVAEGVDVTTGRVLWKFRQSLDVSDAPVVCGGGLFFCFPAFASATTTELVTVDPLTGGVIALLPGPNRNVGVAVTGTNNATSLWQTDATTETLMQTSSSGQRLWSRTVADLFGGSQYSTDFGYDFLDTRNLDIGTVGVRPVGNVESLSQFKTIGVASTNGVVKWRAPGAVFCSGSLQFLTPFVTCNFTGSATISATSLNLKGATLTLEGISASTGKSTWSQRVADVQSLTLGKNIAFSDASHVVVETLAKKWVLLNVKNGVTSTVSKGETFWCEREDLFKVVAIQGEANSSMRASEPEFFGCSATGKAVSAVPSTTPESVGVEVDHEFIWSSSKGLRSAALLNVNGDPGRRSGGEFGRRRRCIYCGCCCRRDDRHDVHARPGESIRLDGHRSNARIVMDQLGFLCERWKLYRRRVIEQERPTVPGDRDQRNLGEALGVSRSSRDSQYLTDFHFVFESR